MWLDLYDHENFRHKLKNGLKTQKRHFLPVLTLYQTVSWPYWLSHINALHINQFYSPYLHEKILRIGGPCGSYEVSFISALWIVSSESRKKTSFHLLCTRLYIPAYLHKFIPTFFYLERWAYIRTRTLAQWKSTTCKELFSQLIMPRIKVK